MTVAYLHSYGHMNISIYYIDVYSNNLIKAKRQ